MCAGSGLPRSVDQCSQHALVRGQQETTGRALQSPATMGIPAVNGRQSEPAAWRRAGSVRTRAHRWTGTGQSSAMPSVGQQLPALQYLTNAEIRAHPDFRVKNTEKYVSLRST